MKEQPLDQILPDMMNKLKGDLIICMLEKSGGTFTISAKELDDMPRGKQVTITSNAAGDLVFELRKK